jgi:GT2 family glycosyltransferase
VERGRVRPEVSVCVVNWNCKEYLRRCLASLTNNRQGVRFEVVVVDNGSTDGAADMVEAEFPGVLLRRNPSPEGFARANNQAVRLSRGRYLFFLNNDTEVPTWTLRKLRDYARAHPEVGMVGPRLATAGGRAQLSARGRPTVGALLHRISWLRWTGLFRAAYRRYRGRDAGQGSRPVEVLMGAAVFLPRSAFRACGGWDESYTFGGEDIALCGKVRERYAVVYHPEVSVLHHGRVSSRQRLGYAHAHTAAGITRQLRASGTPALAVAGYKLAVTLDAPVQWLWHAGRYLIRKLRGRHDRAEKSWQALRASWYFLARGLVDFWKA